MDKESSIKLSAPEFRKRRRERVAVIVLAVFFCVLTYLEIYISNLSQKLPFVNSIFFFGLVNFNVALLLFLSFLIFRNAAKIFSEKRNTLIGSSLQTKLTMAFVSFSIVPTILLFLVSVFYINSSFDKWFSLKIGSVLQDSLEVTNTYFLNSKRKNYHFAHKIADSIVKSKGRPKQTVLSNLRREYSLDAVEFYPGVFSGRVVSLGSEAGLNQVPQATIEFLQKGLSQGAEASTIHQFSEGNLIRCIVPVKAKGKILGAVVVSSYVPLSLISKMDGIAMVYEDYKDVNPLKYPIKSIYMVILVLITVLVIFAATWFGFHLARQLSTPLHHLAEAADQIVQGRFRAVEVHAGSREIYQLVQSFNRMLSDLSASETSLKNHTRYIEVVLSNISAGVISVDQSGKITTLNKYASSLLGIDPKNFIGRHYAEVMPDEYRLVVEDLISKLVKHRARSIQKEVQVSLRGVQLVLQATLSPLKEESGRDLGFVLVIDDLTKLINAQRASAWREVARRIAHEIKNPLTPIKLSAERLQKKFSGVIDDPAFKTCTQTIIEQVDGLKELVGEFSNFARLPQARPVLNDLNGLIGETVTLYQEGHRDVAFVLSLDEAIPQFDLDKDQIRRVLLNIIENALSAIAENKDRPQQVDIATQYDPVLRIARIVISDNGPGVPADIRDRVFEPYVTTKEGGTGLGLAIVKRIIDDHQGFIRLQPNKPFGSKFVIELPVVAKSVVPVAGIKESGINKESSIL